MKIGDGGLQGLVTHDDVARRVQRESQEQKPDGAENKEKQDTSNNAAIDESVLNKAVEKLNENAKVHNLPLEFQVKKEEENTTIEIKNTENGNTREVNSDELPRLMQGMEENIGLLVDEYS